MTGEFFDYFVYVDRLFVERYIAGLKASDQYKKYLIEKNRVEIDEKTEQAFVTGEYMSASEMASAIPYFEDVAFDAACPGSAMFMEQRPYGSIFFCVGAESVNIQGT
jgi:hypothetical protein